MSDEIPQASTDRPSRWTSVNGSINHLSENEKTVLTLLRHEGPAPKSQVAKATGLSAQSASVIMRKLESDGLIERCAPMRGKVGQPSVPMRLSARGALFFGLKVGRRSSDLMLVDFTGRVLDTYRETYAYPKHEAILTFISEALDRLIARLTAADRGRIAGLGISIPNFLWEWGRQVGAPAYELHAWRDVDFRKEVAALVDFPVLLQNDASCACGAEVIFGQGGNRPDFLYFYVGHFIGGGVVLDYRLHTGPAGNSGAIGPLPVPTGTGEIRQLVDIASLYTLEAKLRAAGLDPMLLWAGTEDWSIPQHILDDWTEEAAFGIAYAIVASCSVLDFEQVVIDGWFATKVRDALIARIEAEMDKLNWAGLIRPGTAAGTIGPDARSLGAAGLPLLDGFHA